MNPLLLQLFVYVLIFAATVLAIEGAVGWFRSASGERKQINKRLSLISKGIDRAQVLSILRRTDNQVRFGGIAGRALNRISNTLSQAGIVMPITRFVATMIAIAVAVLLVATLLIVTLGAKLSAGGIFLILLFALIVGFGLPLFIVGRMRDKRVKKLEEQFPVALEVFIRGLRAGHPISSALELLTVDLPDPIGSEFGIVVDEVTYGLELRDALQNMADRCGIEDMHMFVVSLAVQSETGGNLAEILENLGKVIRDRASMVLKVRALSSEGRMTAAMLTGLPIFAFAVLFMLNPKFYLDVAADPAFFPSAIGLILLYGLGFYWIRRLIDLKV